MKIEARAKALKLLKVTYGQECALVSLVDRTILALTDGHNIGAAECIPKFNISETAAARNIGPEHDWQMLIDRLARDYDYSKRRMLFPKPPPSDGVVV